MRILGISAFYHDSAAAIVEDGRVICAAQEERFTRKKHDAGFPHNAVEFCLDFVGVHSPGIDYVAFYDKPFLKFERMIKTFLAFAPAGFESFRIAIPLWIREKLFQKRSLKNALQRRLGDFDFSTRLLFAEHHFSHAASAFYPSPFEEAAVLTIDGVGEWATTSAAMGSGNQLAITKEIRFPHSIGLLYSAFTAYLGFKVNSGEYKVMGLAPYGNPTYAGTILDNVIDLKSDGSFRLNLEYFNYCTGLTMTNDRFSALFGGPPRQPHEPLERRHMDLAASMQAVLDETVLRLTRSLARETGCPNLCLAGGVALNCVANGKVLRDGVFRRLWIQPAAGDAGGALGAALAAYFGYANRVRESRPQDQDAMHGAYLGPEFRQHEIEARLGRMGARFSVLREAALIHTTAATLARGEVAGWFQGRMEFGPRALGSRSIVADARCPAMQSTLNQKIKYRESFRPFAPSVLLEDVADWFELDQESPYMLIVADVAQRRRSPSSADDRSSPMERLKVPRSEIPAVTHLDYSARVHTVDAFTNPKYRALLECFKQITECPVLINTSFNVRGEPIVCTPEDAFRCFMGTEMDALAIGDCFLRKSEQDPSLKTRYDRSFDPD
jgi:carbamoyltransferase